MACEANTGYRGPCVCETGAKASSKPVGYVCPWGCPGINIYSEGHFTLELEGPWPLKKYELRCATGMKYGVGSSSSWSKSMCNPKLGIMRLLPPCQGGCLELVRISQRIPLPLRGKPWGSHMIGWKYRFTRIPPLWMSGRVDGCTESSARKVTHLSTILALDSLTTA